MNSSHDDEGRAGTPLQRDFADRLRTIGDRIPAGDVESDLTAIHRARNAQRRRQRMIPLAAAAAVGTIAVTAAVVLTNSSTDTLTVSSEPSATAGDDLATSPDTLETTSTLPTTTVPDADGVTTSDPSTTAAGAADRVAVSDITTVVVDATVVELRRPVIVDTDAEDVTDLVPQPDQTRPDDLPDDVSYEVGFEWLVEWHGGFLLGRESDEVSGELDVRFSPDGRSWEPIEITPPAGWGAVNDVESTGDRLVVLTNQWVAGTSRPAVWSTTDLTDWASWTIPSEDPAAGFPAVFPVRSSTLGLEIAANDAAWAVQIRGDVGIDTFVLAEDYLDADAAEIDSIGSSFDGKTLTLEIGVGDNETEVVIDVSEDLGLDAEQSRLLEVGAYNEMWIGDWSDVAPVKIKDLPPGSFQGVVATDSALAGWTTTHIGVLENGSDSMRVVTTRPEVAERASITDVYADGDDVIVHANAPSAEAYFEQLDSRTGEWTPLDLDPLPATVRAEFNADDDAVVVSPQSLPGSVPTTGFVEVGNLRYISIFDAPFSTYELRRVDTDEVILTETVDIRVGSDPRAAGWRFEIFDPAENSATDPVTGDVLIDLDDEQASELYSSRTTFGGAPAPNFTLEDFTPRDLWVASVADGAWLLHDLPEPTIDEDGNPRRPPFGLIERVGDVVLVETGDGWLRFELGP